MDAGINFGTPIYTVYQGEIEQKKMRAEGAPENFWGKMSVFKGENAQKHTVLRPNRYFFRDPNLRKIKPPAIFSEIQISEK